MVAVEARMKSFIIVVLVSECCRDCSIKLFFLRRTFWKKEESSSSGPPVIFSFHQKIPRSTRTPWRVGNHVGDATQRIELGAKDATGCVGNSS